MRKLIAATTGLLTVALVGAFASTAAATPLIDFEQGDVVGNTISQTGTTIKGTVNLDVLKYCSDGNNLATCTTYELSGAGTDSSDPYGAAVMTFTTTTSGGGSIALVGGVPALGVPATTALIQNGTFVGTPILINLPSPLLSVFLASGTDVKSPVLLAALGFSTDPPFAFSQFDMGSAQNGTITVTSADFANVPLPEPGSILLLGGGLILGGLGLSKRKKTAKT
jgi:hypothetical protein